MPSIIGSIPDKEVTPLIKYLNTVEQQVGEVDYNEALLSLLLASLQTKA